MVQILQSMSFTLSSTEDIAHTSGKSDVKLTSNNRMNTQSTDNDNEICVTSIKKKAQHTSSVTNTGNKEKQTIDVSTQKHLSNFHMSIQFKMSQCKLCFEAWH